MVRSPRRRPQNRSNPASARTTITRVCKRSSGGASTPSPTNSSLPIRFGEALQLGPSFVAIDLEYTTIGGLIWLTGVAVVDGDSFEYHTRWAHTPEQQALALQNLAGIAADHPAGPIVTWSGESADVPALAAAGRASGLDGLLDDVFQRGSLVRNVSPATNERRYGADRMPQGTAFGMGAHCWLPLRDWRAGVCHCLRRAAASVPLGKSHGRTGAPARLLRLALFDTLIESGASPRKVRVTVSVG
jgi:hypothetical protein